MRRLGVHDADVDDVLQEVFVAVHRKMHEFDPSRSRRSWLPSFAQWGSEYVAAGYLARLGDAEDAPYRIVAAVDGTELTYDPAPPPGAPTRLDGGAVATFWTRDPFVVRSQDPEHPLYVASYMTGCSNVSTSFTMGDPEFVNVVPSGQYLNDYSLFADPTYPDTSLVVVRERGARGFDDVNLECAGGPLSGFLPIGAEGRFEYARIPLTKDGRLQATGNGTCGYGLHHVWSRGPFTATLWGTAYAASYALVGGLAQRTLVRRPLVVR